MWDISLDGRQRSLTLTSRHCRCKIVLTTEPALSWPANLRGQLEQHYSSHIKKDPRCETTVNTLPISFLKT